MESMNGKMVENMKVIGRMEFNMGLENTFKKRVVFGKESGLMAKERNGFES